MPIKRYKASKDNTISTAFKSNLSSTAALSNMGASDILEMFSIFGQASSGSLEQSRVIVEVPVTDIAVNRNTGYLPESGSVTFKLKMFNAAHGQTTPENFSIEALPVVKKWDEGSGLDMESFTDTGFSNWTSSSLGVTWTSLGGDYATGSVIQNAPVPLSYSQVFSSGTEDLEIDITGLVEEWLKDNSGTNLSAAGSIILNVNAVQDQKFKIYAHDGDYRIFQVSNTTGSAGKTSLFLSGTTSQASAANLVASINTSLGPKIAATTTTPTGSAQATLMIDSGELGTNFIDLVNADGTTHRITTAALGGGNPSTATQLNTDLVSHADGATAQLKVSLDAAAAAGTLKMTVSEITNNTSGNPRVITLTQKTPGPTGDKVIEGTLVSNNKIILNNIASSAQGFKGFHGGLAAGPEATLMIDSGELGTLDLDLINSDGTTHKITAAALGDGNPSTATQINTNRFGSADGAAEQLKISLDAAVAAGNLKMSVSKIYNNTSGKPRVITLKQNITGALGQKAIGGTLVSGNKVIVNNISSNVQGTLAFFAPESKIVMSQQTRGFYGNTIISSSHPPAAATVSNFAGGTGAPNYGLLFRLSGSAETGINKKSYYTKKFFARSSQHFFKRPVIEAQWASLIQDDRSRILKSSSLSPASENLNSIYLYNRRRNGMVDIPSTGSRLVVRAYSSISDTAQPISFSSGGGRAADPLNGKDPSYLTASRTSKGLYRAQFSYAGPETTLYDVWSIQSEAGGSDQNWTQIYTGSAFSVLNEDSYSHYETPKYHTNITNLKSTYTNDEIATFRVYTRDQSWKPNIYTVASSKAPINIIRDAFFKITRASDNMVVIPYSTGSTPSYSSLSYDASGSFFDLDMSILEPNYLYEISLLYKDSNDYIEQKEKFKFRVS